MTRSNCPISSALDHLGDKWSLLIIRDIALSGKSAFSALQNSAEGIATNILSSRLSSLEKSGILIKQRDPNDGRRQIYTLTEAGKDLLPILIDMIIWSAKHNPEDLDLPEGLIKRAEKDRQGLLEDLKGNIST